MILSVSLQVEAAGLEYCPHGDIQGGVRCIISAGGMCGVQTKCGAPLLSFSGIGQPGLRATHSETHGHALCHQGLFGRCEETLYPLLCPRVRYSQMHYFHFHCQIYMWELLSCTLCLFRYSIRIILYQFKVL